MRLAFAQRLQVNNLLSLSHGLMGHYLEESYLDRAVGGAGV
jgi:hypothetical protein